MTINAPTIKLNHVNHVVYLVKDTQRSMEFYHDFLGIKQIPSQVDNPNITWLQLPSGVMLHLIETEDAPLPGRESHRIRGGGLRRCHGGGEGEGAGHQPQRGAQRRAAIPVHPRPGRKPGGAVHKVGILSLVTPWTDGAGEILRCLRCLRWSISSWKSKGWG